jgi:hypothetical protein
MKIALALTILVLAVSPLSATQADGMRRPYGTYRGVGTMRGIGTTSRP